MLQTLWKLLKRYEIPVFLFVNKMDQPGADKDQVLGDLKRRLNDGCVDFTETDTEEFYEDVCPCGIDDVCSYAAACG